LGVHVVRDADATRRRLLDAATEEFAAYGIAGARVDRSAEAGKTNKAQITYWRRGIASNAPAQARHSSWCWPATKEKVAKIVAAQREGTLTTRFSAVDLLGLVLNLNSLWASTVPDYDALTARHSQAHRRRVVTDAVVGCSPTDSVTVTSRGHPGCVGCVGHHPPGRRRSRNIGGRLCAARDSNHEPAD
jgi:hypothetical protein